MNKLNLLALLGALAMLVSCEELPPEIVPCQTNRVVLVEEFTGIKCVNCPTGAERLEQISALNPGKVVIVGVHAGFFAGEYQGFDLKCPDGIALEQYLGPVQGYPAATINRKIFDGENQLPLGQSQWAGLIGQEICQPPIANLEMTTTFDSGDSLASIVVDITKGQFFNEDLTHDLALTVMITEDDIYGYQVTPTGSESNYKHKHVLRDVLSNDNKGDVVIAAGNPITTKQVVINNYKIPSDWKPENCHVIAFIHNKSANDISIHQAIEEDLVN